MTGRLLRAVFSTIPALLLASGGCAGEGTSTAGEWNDGPVSSLEVQPPGPLVMGYTQEQRFDVLLKGGDGAPLAGEPVNVSLIGDAHSASASPVDLVTDESGAGSVVFKAPEKPTQLAIRFSSPAAAGDVTVEVVVDPSALGLSVALDYPGPRELASFSAELHDGASCEPSNGLSEPGPDPVEVQHAASMPAELWFEGLREVVEYTVIARGYNDQGEERALACAAGLSAGAAVELALQDRPYNPAGAFTVEAVMETEGGMEQALLELAGGLDPFVDDVPGAILGAIREGLIDAFTAEQFDGIRADSELDLLLGQDLEDRGADAGSALEGLWNAARDRLAQIGIVTRLEIGAVADGVHSIVHTVKRLTFDGIEAPYQVAQPDQGHGTAQASDDDPDLLEIAVHSMALGLGGGLMHVVEAEIAAAWEAADLPEALETVIDCEAVTEVLAEPLSEVVVPLEIHAGCVAAMAAAGGAIGDRKTQVDLQYSQLELSGSCRLEDPGIGDSVIFLVEGVFAVIWGGVEALGPMVARFSGHLE